MADRDDQTAVRVSAGGVIYGEMCAHSGDCLCVGGRIVHQASHYLLSPITGWIYGHRREAVKSPVVR